ncbi:MAG TPA: sugar transferase [Candidatus Saccharimonadales bacterium]|jgi:exopolysaccharide biosynthesis polyprenyl glycosylphosphotransferase
MKSNASLIYNFCLVVGDFLALVAAFLGAFGLRGLSSVPVAHPIHLHTYVGVFLALLPFWILIFALLGLYNSNIYEKRFSELPRLLIGSFIGLTFVIFWNFVSVKPIFPAKLVPIYGFVLAFLLLIIFRNVARLSRGWLFGYKVGLSHVLIVGNTGMSHELIDSLVHSRQSGYKIVAVVGGKLAVGEYKLPLYARFSQFLQAHPEPNLHGIIQTELYADEARNAEILTYAQEHHATYRFVPGNTELFVGNVNVELFRGSTPVITVRQTALFGWGRIVKRLFDLAVGNLLLIITSPIMLVVALLVKLSDGGPVFLRQARLTRFNQEFRVFKFRTNNGTYNGLTPDEAFAKMGRPDLLAEFRANGNFLPDDPRNTRIGKFLRASSLDELPQLFNVFRGELSLVGPRALIPKDLAEYKKRHTILSVKSGITGLAQVSGRNNIPVDERRKLDLYYAQNWTFWLDIVILLKTFKSIFSHEYDGK